MADYWRQRRAVVEGAAPGRNSTSSADKSRPFENPDLMPCPMEPILDAEPALSSVRTGCVDIDLDTSGFVDLASLAELKSTDDIGGGEETARLAEVGLRASVVAAGSRKGGGSTRGGWRIDMREIEHVPRSPRRKKERRRSGEHNPQQHQQQQRQQQPVHPAENPTGLSPIPSPRVHLPPPVGVHHHHQTLASSPTRSFDAVSDKAPSTRSSTAASSSARGSAVAESLGWNKSKNKGSPLPDPEQVFATGPILARTSLRSLVMKKWNASHWCHYTPYSLLIFRSKDHLDDWRHNPYHGAKQRDYLVKARIDFDMENCDQTDKRILGHRVGEVKRKRYAKDEPELYQFKVERWTTVGGSTIAAFASRDEGDAQILHDIIHCILETCPQKFERSEC